MVGFHFPDTLFLSTKIDKEIHYTNKEVDNQQHRSRNHIKLQHHLIILN